MIFILIVITICVVFYLYRREKMKFFEKLGVKGPKPNFLFGNLMELRNTLFPDLFQKWERDFGKVFGYFEGPTPVLVISDADLLQEVMVKQFSNFHGRKLFPTQLNPDEDPKVSMFLARGKRWKRLRTTINPAFSENKMRRMYPMIDDCIQSMMSSLTNQVSSGNSEMNIQEPFQRLTMDVICKCAFGVETNCQTNINNPFIVCLKRFMSTQSFSTLKAAIVLTFPEIKHWILKFLNMINMRTNTSADLITIREKMIEVIEARKQCPEKRPDLLQLLLDSEMPGATMLDEENLCPINNISALVKEDSGLADLVDEAGPSKKTSSKSGKPMTTEEIISQANLFLFAGYETSSTALTFLTYKLAEHRNIQRNLHKEIDDAFSDKDYENMSVLEFYDTISKLPYLTAIIFEVLRHYPFAAPVVTRMCLKSEGTYLSNGLFISHGLNVVPNSYALHFDSDIWTTLNPKLFDPERFLHIDGASVEFIGPPHPMAWIPFGAGPRNCIGQRFAMMVIKSTVVRFFKEFTVEATNKTEFPLVLRAGATIAPKNGVTVRLIERKSSKPDKYV